MRMLAIAVVVLVGCYASEGRPDDRVRTVQVDAGQVDAGEARGASGEPVSCREIASALCALETCPRSNVFTWSTISAGYPASRCEGHITTSCQKQPRGAAEGCRHNMPTECTRGAVRLTPECSWVAR